MPNDNGVISVFPLSGSVLGMRADWLTSLVPRLIHPSYILMAFMLVLWVLFATLKRFEGADFDKKAWNVPVVVTSVVFWPTIVIGLKVLIDTFNTFLVNEVFKIPWHGFGFPRIDSVPGLLSFPAEALARFLPNLAYWIVYTFFVIFFFFYATLGPLVMAKGILADEIETIMDLLQEVVVLLLWQTTFVIFVAFVMPDIVSGRHLPANPPTNFYFMSFVLAIMIFFVPSVTRKFTQHIQGTFVPLGFRWGGAMLGIAAVGRAGSATLAAAGVPAESGEIFAFLKNRLSKVEEFRTRFKSRLDVQERDRERAELESKLRHDSEEEEKAREKVKESPLDLFKRAKKEAEEPPHE